MMYTDTLTYLPDDILVKVDRASMGVSLEARSPFLDHRVVEFAWRLPLRMKVQNDQGKVILKRLLYRHLPESLFDRAKAGFAMPVDDWLRGPLRPWVEDLLNPPRLKREGYLRAEPVRAAWQEHLSGMHNHQAMLWVVLMFQSWLSTV